MNKITALIGMFLLLACFATSLTLKQDACTGNGDRLGPIGGRGGNYFNDSSNTNNKIVHPYIINIRSDKYINSIQIIYKDAAGNTVYGGTHGGDGGSPSSWAVPEGQKIVKAIVSGGAWVDSIQFITDGNTPSPKWGGTGGTRVELNFSGTLTSIWGRSSELLDQIGFNICNLDNSIINYR